MKNTSNVELGHSGYLVKVLTYSNQLIGLLLKGCLRGQSSSNVDLLMGS